MWWERAVVYQVYPRSYADSNADGIGDLPGVISKLDHLEWLGVDAVWLSPTFPSPNCDWGYDVADYYDVHPELGSLADLEELIVEAGRRHLRVLLDLVPNHTSDRHPWFRDPAKRHWYVWRDPKPDGSPPNNWKAVFGGSAWTFDERSGQYYLHNFLPEQPDLDWWNDEVRAAFDEILRFWFERGIDGFRIDVAHALVKDKLLRDNPPARRNESSTWQRLGQWPKYNMGLPDAVDVHRRMRPDRAALAARCVRSLPRRRDRHGSGASAARSPEGRCGARSLPDADGVARRRRRGLHRVRCRAVAAHRRPLTERRDRARRSRLDPEPDARPDRSAQAPPDPPRRLRARRRAGERLGIPPRRRCARR